MRSGGFNRDIRRDIRMNSVQSGEPEQSLQLMVTQLTSEGAVHFGNLMLNSSTVKVLSSEFDGVSAK